MIMPTFWNAVRYLDPDSGSAFDKIPPLVRGDGSTTGNTLEQGNELIRVFFPPLPTVIDDEGIRPQRRPVLMPQLTIEGRRRGRTPRHGMETDMARGQGKSSPAVPYFPGKGRAAKSQWRHASIILLKKPEKRDYTKAKAWRPISLLSILGKLLEAAVAERISFAVETHGMLPANHFGARKARSTEQALLLLQECIYKAWRSRKVVSLISFDVAGAYNGVCKDRLLQCLRARGIPHNLIAWIDAFCSRRTASIIVNGQASQLQPLP